EPAALVAGVGAVDAEDVDLVAVGPPERLDLGGLLDARAAPAGPQDDHQWLAVADADGGGGLVAQAGQFERAERLDRHLAGRAGDRPGRFGGVGAACGAGVPAGAAGASREQYQRCGDRQCLPHRSASSGPSAAAAMPASFTSSATLSPRSSFTASAGSVGPSPYAGHLAAKIGRPAC